MQEPQQLGIWAGSYTTPQLTARHRARPGIEPSTSWFLVRFVNHWATTGKALYWCKSLTRVHGKRLLECALLIRKLLVCYPKMSVVNRLFFRFFRTTPILEVPRLEVESEPQLPAYTTATATRDPSLVCDISQLTAKLDP